MSCDDKMRIIVHHLALRVLILARAMAKAGEYRSDGLCVVQSTRKHHVILVLHP